MKEKYLRARINIKKLEKAFEKELEEEYKKTLSYQFERLSLAMHELIEVIFKEMKLDKLCHHFATIIHRIKQKIKNLI